MYVWLALAVFTTSFVLDAATTRYVCAATAGQAHRAAQYSVLMWAMSTVGTLAILKVDVWLAPWEAIGLYAGSWAAVRQSKRNVSASVESRKPDLQNAVS